MYLVLGVIVLVGRELVPEMNLEPVPAGRTVELGRDTELLGRTLVVGREVIGREALGRTLVGRLVVGLVVVGRLELGRDLDDVVGREVDRLEDDVARVEPRELD